MVLTLADMEGNETFDPSALGTCDEVAEERVADDNMLVLRGCKWVAVATGCIWLRGQAAMGAGAVIWMCQLCVSVVCVSCGCVCHCMAQLHGWTLIAGCSALAPTANPTHPTTSSR